MGEVCCITIPFLAIMHSASLILYKLNHNLNDTCMFLWVQVSTGSH